MNILFSNFSWILAIAISIVVLGLVLLFSLIFLGKLRALFIFIFIIALFSSPIALNFIMDNYLRKTSHNLAFQKLQYVDTLYIYGKLKNETNFDIKHCIIQIYTKNAGNTPKQRLLNLFSSDRIDSIDIVDIKKYEFVEVKKYFDGFAFSNFYIDFKVKCY